MMKTNEVLETIKARRSVRVYDKKQVPSEDLNAILEAATYAPSGMHYETWHFTAVRNAAKLEAVPLRICFWQPVLWASVLAGSINSGRLAMIRKSGRI